MPFHPANLLSFLTYGQHHTAIAGSAHIFALVGKVQPDTVSNRSIPSILISVVFASESEPRLAYSVLEIAKPGPTSATR